MTEGKTEYYVYVYIDPRNFEEFYYGKGKGNRKEAHLSDDSDSEKVKRIKAIHKEGLKPIIKVIAKDLTEREAFFIEKTLIWKLGRTLTNRSSGHFADKFRPHDTLHQDLSGFDFKNGVYYINVGESVHRCWDDCRQFNFLSAGQDKKYSDPLKTLKPGDIAIPYLKNHGFVGIGRVTERAVPIANFKHNGKSLRDTSLKIRKMFDNYDNDKSEYLIKVVWIKTVDSKQAKWKSNNGLFTSQLIKASLQGQPKTIEFIEKEFEIKLADYLLID